MNPDSQKLTCEKGCGKCCDVGGTDKILFATAEEAEAIGRVIGRLPARCGKRVDQIEFGIKNEQPCPFLVGGGCSVYSVRPAVCRMYQCDLSDPGTKSTESFREIEKSLDDLIAHGVLVADLREWFPKWIGLGEGSPINIAAFM